MKHLFRTLNFLVFVAAVVLLNIAIGVGLMLDVVAGLGAGVRYEPFILALPLAALSIAALTMLLKQFGAIRTMGFKVHKLGKALLFCLPLMLYIVAGNFCRPTLEVTYQFKISPVVGLGLLCASVTGALVEEFLFRGVIVNAVMSRLGNKPIAVWLSVLLSSACSALFCVAALIDDYTPKHLMMQTVYVLSVSSLFSAVYLRTRSMTGIVAAHSFKNMLIFTTSYISTACLYSSMLRVQAMMSVSTTVVAFIGMTFFLLRPEKQREIQDLWREEAGLGMERAPIRNDEN